MSHTSQDSLPAIHLENTAESTYYLYFCLWTSLLSTFLFGYHSAVINQPKDAMTQCKERSFTCYPMTEFQWGIFVSIFVLGGIIGGCLGGSLATRFGRRFSLWLNNFGFLLGTLCFGIGHLYEWLVFGRFVIGISTGIGTVLVPLYLAELAPLSQRGQLGTLNQLSIVCGALASGIFGIFLSRPETWRILFLIGGLPSLCQCFLLLFTIETPTWLAMHSLHDQARASLQYLRGKEDVEEELRTIFKRVGVETIMQEEEDSREPISQQPLTLFQLLQNRPLHRFLLAAFGLQIAQQASGINAAIYYSTTIFSRNYSTKVSIQLTLLVSVVSLIMTWISSLFIEHWGRRTLLLLAQFMMALFAFCLGILSLNPQVDPIFTVVSLLLFVAGFGLGMGSIPWLILPELVPSYALGISASICTALNWTTNFVIALLLPMLIELFGCEVFFLFALLLCIFMLFTFLYVPETKGKMPEELLYSDS